MLRLVDHAIMVPLIRDAKPHVSQPLIRRFSDAVRSRAGTGEGNFGKEGQTYCKRRWEGRLERDESRSVLGELFDRDTA